MENDTSKTTPSLDPGEPLCGNASDIGNQGRAVKVGPQSTKTHLIEIAFDDLDERDLAYDAIEKLLVEMGQIGTLSARTELMDDKPQPQPIPDYRSAGWIGEIPKLSGRWRRMPDEIRYLYGGNTSCQCPICLEQAAGNPWAGWFVCDYKGCCVALVNTGEVFVRVSDDA